ncbi:MAG: 3-phosphoshikimate 1-carboxyvinyltransferase [Gemmatimonadaceae bacterium]|nr:3-phosphoshikimate 1-carboxyvinyltransferase [Gemmatimonadaceae bacterium]MDQ3517772.1 3-phosphoshikimate 1-carboxyvinyltransferase [Gemmatimonadota bacterium]
MIVAGELSPPGDKSISHRALLLASLATGCSRIRGLSPSSDVESTSRVLRLLGARIPELSGEIFIEGVGIDGLKVPRSSLDCGNSGTTARLTAGVVSACAFRTTFIGDPSLSRRPMRRVAEPLRFMGAEVTLQNGDCLPMTVSGGSLRPINWSSGVASAQVKSAVLLAGIAGRVTVTFTEPHPSRDHTERMLAQMGVTVRNTGNRVILEPSDSLQPLDLHVPGDPSSAAYLVALATLAQRGSLTVRHVCLNETRTGFYRILARMGGDVRLLSEREEGGEPTGSIDARHASLAGVDVTPDEIPSVIDELPLLACLAARANGVTTIAGAAELRVKESDRIFQVVSNLRQLGVEAEEFADGMRITGTDAPMTGRVITNGDHRIAMAFGVLALDPRNSIEIDDPGCVAVSYPNYWSDARSLLK